MSFRQLFALRANYGLEDMKDDGFIEKIIMRGTNRTINRAVLKD
jgi:hypothetical protein